MKFMFFLASIICSPFFLVLALPIISVMRDVWDPQITSPNSTTTWVAGRNYTVTWETSSKPSEVTNTYGEIYLRHNGLTQPVPLASNFNLTDGQVSVFVPADTQPDDDWVIVLFGDSGNWSPPFTIVAYSDSS